MLVILTPQAMTDPTRTAEAVAALGLGRDKPILASWMGGPAVAAGDAVLNRANIPTFSYPDTAARVFNCMWRYHYDLQELYETPSLPKDEDDHAPDRDAVKRIVATARAGGRTLLTEEESKDVLAAYGIPVVTTRVARNVDEAVTTAEKMGYPVVLKLYSHTITHKTDVGGVQLDLKDRSRVIEAYRAIQTAVTEKAGAEHFNGVTVQPMVRARGHEVIIGSSIDPQFGPVLLFGAGGQLVEVLKDRALGLPPLNTTLARRMMEQTRIYAALKGVRGQRGVDMAELEALLVQFSQLVSEQRLIREIDINPVLASPEQLVALDARVVLHEPGLSNERLPTTAIRPYPHEYTSQASMRDGTTVTIRPIRPEDEPLMVRFHETLSDDTVHFRYFGMISLHQRVRHERLTRLCFIDYDRAMALVAERKGPETGERELLGVARYSRVHASNDAEFAIVISDRVQHQGLGTLLMERLIEIARAEKIARIVGTVLADNKGMLHVCRRFGFEETRSPHGPVYVELGLGDGTA
jgi:acetyltransferase